MSKSRSKLEEIFKEIENRRRAASMSAGLKALKEVYSQSFNDLVFKENPFLKIIPKEDQFQGATLPTPVEYGEKGPKTK